MSVYDLMQRIAKEFSNNDIYLKDTNFDGYISDYKSIIGARFYRVNQVYRHNGATTNVTAKIVVYEIKYVRNNSCTFKILAEIKVPKDASDRVIANRVSKAIEAYNS